VAGNHDLFPSRRVQSRNIRLLDGEITELDTLRIGGVGGIIGDPGRPNRHTEEDFAARLEDGLTGPDPVQAGPFGPSAAPRLLAD